MKRVYSSVLFAAALGTVGLTALAQMGPQADHPAMMHMGGMHHGNPTKVAEKVQQHLSTLKNKLHITASQEGAWTPFAAAMQPTAKPNAAWPSHAELDHLTTPERIDKMKQLRVQHHETMLAQMGQRDEAVKALYNTLNADQKKVFDAEHSRMGRRGGHHDKMKS